MLSDVALPVSRRSPETAPAESVRFPSEQETISKLRQQLAEKSVEAAQQKFFLQKAREALVHLRQLVKILSVSPSGGTTPLADDSRHHAEQIEDPEAIANLLRAQQATIERLTHELRVAKSQLSDAKAVATLNTSRAENFVAISFEAPEDLAPKVDFSR